MPLAGCQSVADTRHAIKYEIIEIKCELHHKLHKKKRTEIWTIDFFLNYKA